MKRFVLAALIASALGIVAAVGSSLATAASPPPAALQYEQITRFVIPPATPEPPGLFQDDRGTIMAAANQPPQHHGLFGGVLNAYQGAMNGLQSLQTGLLERRTYFGNWERTDDVAHQTATITKCDLHQYITLDLVHHTYTIASTLPSPEPMTMPMQHSGRTQVQNEAPGTEDITISNTHANLGPRTLERVATHGDSATYSVVTSNATGSCSNGSASFGIVRYESGIGIPRAYCPLPQTRGVPSSPQDMVVHGGCRPRVHGSAAGFAGFAMAGTGTKLDMYTLLTFGGQGQEVHTMTEAGNVRWLGRPEAEALFSIPAGFTRQSP